MLVMKFGGTSVQSSAAMRRVIAITLDRKNSEQLLVVASACAGVTNQLVALADIALQGKTEELQKNIAELLERHTIVCQELTDGEEHQELRAKTTARIAELIAELSRLCEGISLLKECTPRSRALLLSFGERLSNEILTAGMLAHGISATLVDARSVLRTDDDFLSATALMPEVERLAKRFILPHLEQGNVVVTQGFIGSNAREITTVLGRGGSDLSAAIFGAAMNAREILIWTDVSGIFTADPRIVPSARTVAQMSFAEAGELAYFGAKVLHPDTVRPAVEKRIPVRVLNTFHPEEAGTLLTPDITGKTGEIRAVTAKKGNVLLFCALKPTQDKMQFLAKFYGIFHKYGLHALCAEGAERFYAVALNASPKAEHAQKELAELCDCTLESATIICASGADFSSSADESALARFAAALQPFGIRWIQQAANSIALIAVISENFADEALKSVHELVGQ